MESSPVKDQRSTNCATQPTVLTHTTLFAIKGSNNKKQTKQRKRSKINHCKISPTQQDNTIQY